MANMVEDGRNTKDAGPSKTVNMIVLGLVIAGIAAVIAYQFFGCSTCY